MTDAEVDALRQGDLLYEVEEVVPLDASLTWRVKLYHLSSPRVTAHQKSRGTTTILIEVVSPGARSDGRTRRVSVAELHRKFERTAAQAVNAFKATTAYRIEQAERDLISRKRHAEEALAWVAAWETEANRGR